eukprot:gnl/Dysnectes_brevis/2374_a2805_663.p1 GENE.gnl/Dysnectes_brevis/2374_a2805_663~~gnl/Dysnectes_brevis/2374_a2805_663.p1  ORF type:complete len:516 (+),score=167.05 gnl/Dysnectes_brevis/2374_a2805_663:38-1549(+)
MSELKKILSIQASVGVLSFVTNSLVAKIAGPEVLGFTSFKLQIAINLCVSFARDPIRRLLLTSSFTKSLKSSQTIEYAITMSILIPIIAILTLLFTAPFGMFIPSVLLATISQALAEPPRSALLHLQGNDALTTYAKVERVASIGNTLYTLLGLLVSRSSPDLLPVWLAMAPGLQATLSLLMMCRAYTKEAGTVDNAPKITEFPAVFIATARRMVKDGQASTVIGQLAPLLLQTLSRAGLGEGTSIALSASLTDEQLGLLTVMSTLVAMGVRFVLAPVEEAALTRISLAKQNNDPEMITSVLKESLTASVTLGLLYSCIGAPLGRLIVPALWGEQYAAIGGAALFSLVCVEMLPMACAGMAETLTHATLSPDRINSNTLALSVLSLGRAGLTYLCCSRWGVQACLWVAYLSWVARTAVNVRQAGTARLFASAVPWGGVGAALVAGLVMLTLSLRGVGVPAFGIMDGLVPNWQILCIGSVGALAILGVGVLPLIRSKKEHTKLD